MSSVSGDDFIERLSRYIQANSTRLAAPPLGGRRNGPSSSLPWASSPAKPLSLRITPHNLFYLLLRLEAIGLDVGRLDVRLGDDTRRAISFVEPRTRERAAGDWSETGSFRSMTSAVSSLSLGGWWGTSKAVDPGASLSSLGGCRAELRRAARPLVTPPRAPKLMLRRRAHGPSDSDATLKLIYSAFTKLPSLVVHAAGLGDETIAEMAGTGPLDCCVPLRIFRNLQLCASFPPFWPGSRGRAGAEAIASLAGSRSTRCRPLRSSSPRRPSCGRLSCATSTRRPTTTRPSGSCRPSSATPSSRASPR